MADITMPQLGETVTEGTITKWFKKVGDQVAADEVLFEVSTDKVDSEVPSSAAGYLAEILVQEGETVDVGTRLAVISDAPPADGGGETDEGHQEERPEADGKAEAAVDGGAPTDGEQAQPQGEDDTARPAKAEAEAKSAEREASRAEATDRGEAPAPAPAPAPSGDGDGDGAPEPAPATTAPRSSGPASGGKLLSPVVRRLISEHQLDPEEIPGSGQGGRITRADVLAYIDRGAAARAKAPSPPGDGDGSRQAPAKPAPAAKPGTDDEVLPFSNIRRRTAEHMVRSQATSAHVLTVTEVDFHGVERVRQAMKEEWKAKEGFSLTYLPFICRAAIDAIEDFPHVNSSVGDNELIIHRRVHLGIAVDLNFEGLIVPVVHDADQKRLRAIARAIADLAKRARSRELSADDISGGTFTITNPGPFGTFITAPVINQPQVAILSTDGIKKRPVALELPDGSDAVVVHPVGMLGLSFDHRAFDGAYASAFLSRCREILETRDWAQEL